MSESFHFVHHSPDEELRPATRSLLDPLIDDEIKYTLEQDWIPADERDAILQESRRSEKVNKICYNLAMHPETEDNAVKLRSLYLVRTMDIEAKDLLPEESWDYTYSLNDFWGKVESEANALLPQLADELFDGHVTESPSPVNPSSVIGVQRIARFGSRTVLRETYRTIDQPLPHTVKLRIPEIS